GARRQAQERERIVRGAAGRGDAGIVVVRPAFSGRQRHRAGWSDLQCRQRRGQPQPAHAGARGAELPAGGFLEVQHHGDLSRGTGGERMRGDRRQSPRRMAQPAGRAEDRDDDRRVGDAAVSELILGIDGGGSKALVALADKSGQVLQLSRGDGINPMDNRAWRHGLEAQLKGFAKANGLAGIGAALPAYGEVEQISADQRNAIAAAFGTIPQRVLNDVDAAQIGAFAGGPGILILAGTGSMAWARDASGRSHRVGGWGEVIGDEGSGNWIGHRVLGLVSQSLDGRAAPTRLVDAVFAALKLDTSDPHNALEGWVSRLTHPRSQISALATVAGEVADTGDVGAI